MDVIQLRYLLAVVDTGSLSKASELLRVSQPALTQRMNQLEREVDIRLLERGPRGARLTAAGEDFVRDARRLVRQFDHLAEYASTRSDVRGLVAVGLPSGAARYLAAPLWNWLRTNHPGLRLELFESMSGYVEEMFAGGRIDVVLRYQDAGASPQETTVTDRLYSEDLYLVGEPPGGLRHPRRVSVDELDGVPLVAPGARSSLRTLVERACRAHNVTPSVVADVESLMTMLSIAAGGQACAVLPVSALEGSSTPVRRFDPALTRHAVIASAADPGASADAVDAVRTGIAAVVHDLAATGRWPGIRLPEE